MAGMGGIRLPFLPRGSLRERGRELRLGPGAGLDQVAGLHGGEGARDARIAALPGVPPGDLQDLARLFGPPLLKVGVGEPRQAVEVAFFNRQTAPLRPGDRGGPGGLVGGDDLVPLPELDEDVRRHVERVVRLGGHPGIGAGGAHAERRVGRVVVGVDQVVEHPRMLGVAVDPLLQDGGGPHQQPVARLAERSAVRGEGGSDQRQGVEARHFEVVRPALVELPHGLGVGAGAVALLPFAVQGLDRGEPAPLPVIARFRRPGLGRGAEALQGLPGRVHVLLTPDRVVVGQGLAPVGQSEPRLGLLRLPEGVGGLVVPEAVQGRDPAQKVGLRLRRGGGREIDAAERGAGGPGGGERPEGRNDQGAGQEQREASHPTIL
jgi:hypothetical protein